MSGHRTIYPCRCSGHHYLDLSIYQDGDSGDDIHFWSVVNPPRRFSDRLRGAWGILTGRDYYVNSEVILEKQQVIALWQDLRDRVGGMEAYSVTTTSTGQQIWEKLIELNEAIKNV